MRLVTGFITERGVRRDPRTDLPRFIRGTARWTRPDEVAPKNRRRLRRSILLVRLYASARELSSTLDRLAGGRRKRARCWTPTWCSARSPPRVRTFRVGSWACSIIPCRQAELAASGALRELLQRSRACGRGCRVSLAGRVGCRLGVAAGGEFFPCCAPPGTTWQAYFPSNVPQTIPASALSPPRAMGSSEDQNRQRKGPKKTHEISLRHVASIMT